MAQARASGLGGVGDGLEGPRAPTLGLAGTPSHRFGELAQLGERLAWGKGGGAGTAWERGAESSTLAGRPGLMACLGDWCLEGARLGLPGAPLSHMLRRHSQVHACTYPSTPFSNCIPSLLPIPLLSSISPSYVSFHIYCYCLSPCWNASSTGLAAWLTLPTSARPAPGGAPQICSE